MNTLEFDKACDNRDYEYEKMCADALNMSINALSRAFDYCDGFDDEMKIKAYKYILSKIEYLHLENKRLLDYDWHIYFTDEEITQQVNTGKYDSFRSFREASESLNPRDCSKEYSGFLDEDGQPISDDEIGEILEIRENAWIDLINEYNAEHSVGYAINQRLKELTLKCEQAIAVTNDKLEFVKRVLAQDNTTPESPSLSELFIKDRTMALRFIDNELRACSRPQGKLIAMMIIALCEKGYLPHYSGKLTEIYSAFKRLYPNKVGTPRGIEDYIRGYYKPSDNNPKTIPNHEIEALKNKLL